MTPSAEAARSQWLDLVTDALVGFGNPFPWDRACRILGEQFEAPLAGKFVWDCEGHASITAYPFPDEYDLADVAGRAPAVHPLALYYSSHATRDPLSTTQVPFVGGAAIRDYAEELRVFGIDNHLWIPVDRTKTSVLVVGVARPVDPFGDRSLMLARIAQHVILALHRHCLVIDEWVAEHPLATGAYALADEVRLTSRQVVVLTLVAQGLTSRAIGYRLGISPRTVERHLQNIYTQLGVSDRVSAVRLGTQSGVLSTVVDDDVSPLQLARPSPSHRS